MKEGITICLTAWKTQDYIEECLDSIENQTYFKDNDEYEILLGIDGCKDTLKKVQKIRHKYRNLKVFMMLKNSGTYITSNTMLSMAKYDWFLRFDTDDIMHKDMIETLMKDKGAANLVRFKMQNFPGKPYVGLAYGQLLIKTDLIKKYGGYMPWKCGADTEFLTRTSTILKPKIINKVIFDRRIHELNLTVEKSSNHKSELRKEYHKYVDNESIHCPIIEMITSDYIEIPSDYNQIDELEIQPHGEWKYKYESSTKRKIKFIKHTDWSRPCYYH